MENETMPEPKNDLELYRSGQLNSDEQEQWDHVTNMMAAAGEWDGWGPAQDAYVRMQDGAFDDEYEEWERVKGAPPVPFDDEEIPF